MQGELIDYLLALRKLHYDGKIRDAAGMKRAGKIIGTSWADADRNGRASALTHPIFEDLHPSLLCGFLEGSEFPYDSGNEEQYSGED